VFSFERNGGVREGRGTRDCGGDCRRKKIAEGGGTAGGGRERNRSGESQQRGEISTLQKVREGWVRPG